MSGATAALAGWSRALAFERLPGDVVERVLAHTLDAVGALVVGATRPWTAQVRDYVAGESPPGRCAVPGLDARVRPEWAALANGTAAHGFEIDDYALPGLSHPGCVVVPTALALAEHEGCDGRELIAALAAGFETTVRFGLACTPSLTSDRGFHVTSALGVFGAAAVAARLLRLAPAHAAAAFGLAAAHACGTTEFTRTGGDVKRLHAGMAAAAGIRSASIARRGFSAPLAAIEGERGFLNAFVAHARAQALTDGLGDDLSDGLRSDNWALRGLAIKRWCVCAGLQAPLAALEALKARGLRLADASRIAIGVDPATLAHVGAIGAHPRDMTEAQMSAHHAIAMSVVVGGNDPIHYAAFESGDARLAAVGALAQRVVLRVDAEAAALFPRRLVAEVEVTHADGSTDRARAEAPGTPGTPMSSADIAAKFRALCEPVVGGAATQAAIAAVAALRDGGPPAAVLAAIGRFDATR